MLETLKNKITLGDSFEILKQIPDKCIDLILTDPPYGIKANSMQLGRNGHKLPRASEEWDSETPSDEFFLEMIRVSKNQIIFGGNYFPILWKFGGKGFIFWDKCQPSNSFMDCFADGELAWTSYNKPAKRYKYPYYGNIDGNTKATEKIHPTQKPLKLFEIVLRDYLGDLAGGGRGRLLIADFFSGSGTTAVACHNLGLDFIAVERDENFYKLSSERLENAQAQQRLFFL